jgi:hypothetical protein
MERLLELWFFLGSINLILLTVEDYRKHMIVDSRKNYIMTGLSIALITISSFKWYYYIIVLVLAIVLVIYLTKYKIMGGADVDSFIWLYLGFAYVHPFFLLLFMGIFLFGFGCYAVAKKYIFRITQPTPLYAIFLISFLWSAILIIRFS